MDTMDIDAPPVESLKREREDAIASEEPLQKKARVDDDDDGMPALRAYFKVLIVDPDQPRAYVLSWDVEAEDVEGGLAGILRCLDTMIAADYAQQKPFTAMVLGALAAKIPDPFYHGVHRNEEAHAYWTDCRSAFDCFKVTVDSYRDGEFKVAHLFGMSAHREIRSSFSPYNSDQVNFFKARMTSFSETTKYFKIDDVASKPESDEMTGITTKYREEPALNLCRDPRLDGPGKSRYLMPPYMDENVRRRLLIDVVDNEQTEGVEAQTELTRAQHRELFLAKDMDEMRRRAIHTFAQLNKEEDDDEMPDLVSTLQGGLHEEKLND
jgi:hypothetical protein